MLMTAKYPGRCVCCSRPVKAGDRIEWAHGESKHASCAARELRAAERAPAASSPEPVLADPCWEVWP